MDATTVAMCDLEDRIASDYETGFSEQALRQLMKEAFLLEMERKRQMGEAMLSGKVAPLQADFVNDEQQRLLEIEDMRLVVKFGEKKRYSDQECQAGTRRGRARRRSKEQPGRHRSGFQGAQCRRRGCGSKALFQRLSRQCSQAA